MLQWYRWQDWLNLILGVWLFLSPGLFQVPLGGSAAWIGWFMGIIIIAMAIWALAVPDDREVEFTRGCSGGAALYYPLGVWFHRPGLCLERVGCRPRCCSSLLLGQ